MAVEKKDKKEKKVTTKKTSTPKEKKVKEEKVVAEKKIEKDVEKEEPKMKEEIKEEIKAEKEKVKDTKPSKKGFFVGTGRRKTAIARVFLWDKKGEFTVNGVSINDYFESDVDKTKWEKPFHAIGVSHPEAKYSATIKTAGSGKPSQMDAIILGIARALSKIDDEFDKVLRKQSFMTRDSRMVERKKPFFHKARKKPQYSKR
jgi:small subunit ribosomal protein S9